MTECIEVSVPPPARAGRGLFLGEIYGGFTMKMKHFCIAIATAG